MSAIYGTVETDAIVDYKEYLRRGDGGGQFEELYAKNNVDGSKFKLRI